MIMRFRIYYYFWLRAHRAGLLLWLYRRWAAAMEIYKHIQRGNYRQALNYLKIL